MNLSDRFIRRPVMTSLLMLAVLLFGGFAYRLLPVNDLPSVDFPTIQVRASLPGASPETMASAVATPLERQLSTIAGLEALSSTNGQGSTMITLQFTLERDIDAAAQDVQSAISQAARQLPRDMPSPPSMRKVNPADSPVLYLALSSPSMALSEINEYADTVISPRISMISRRGAGDGVRLAEIRGAHRTRSRAADRSPHRPRRGVGGALASGNVNLPTGGLQGENQAFTTPGQRAALRMPPPSAP